MRRIYLALAVVAVVTAAAYSYSSQWQQLARLDRQVAALQDRIRQLSYNTASGGGINLKFMPHPETGKPTVPLEEQFSFDRNHAVCRVSTNPQAFKMKTFQLGEVTVQPHSFFMQMVATTVDQYHVTTLPDGKRKVTIRGGVSCATEVGQGKVRLGSRTVSEHATYLIEAVDGGSGAGKAEDTFAFTAFFEPKEAPVNYQIFGPKFTFTGKMVEGKITIIDPSR